MNPGQYISVFDPIFAYRRAERMEDEQTGLLSFLRLAGESFGREYEKLPLQTAYHRYGPTMVIVFELLGEYVCQTVVNGAYDDQFYLPDEADKLRAFFAEHDTVVVLENDKARALKPSAEAIINYAEALTEVRRFGEQHRATLEKYRYELDQFVYNAEVGLGHGESAYKDMLTFMQEYLQTLDNFADGIANEKVTVANSYLDKGEIEERYRMFGLYIYALRLGIVNKRYLERKHPAMERAFSLMLDDMHTYMQSYPGIETAYADVMHLPANERARLHALLLKEGLYDEDWGCIGNDFF